MNKKNLTIALITLVIIALISFWYVNKKEAEVLVAVTEQNNNFLPSINPQTTDNQTDLNARSDTINTKLLEIYTSLFAESWLDRKSDTMFEASRTEAQGTENFREFYRNNINLITPEPGVETRLEEQPNSFIITNNDIENPATQISGTLVTTSGLDSSRKSVIVTISWILVEKDYLIDSITVTDI